MEFKENKDTEAEEIKKLSYLDLYKRSKKGALSYLLLYPILIFSTPYYKEHSVICLITGIIIVVISLIRIYSASIVKTNYNEKPEFWNTLLFILTCINCLTWGFFCCITLFLYEPTDLTSFYVVILTVGLAAGGLKSNEPDLKLLIITTLLMIIPWLTLLFIKGAIAYGGFISIYTILVISLSIEASKAYIDALKNNLLIQKQKIQMVTTVSELTNSSSELDNSSQSLSGISSNMHNDSIEMSTKSEGVATSAGVMNNNMESIAAATEETSTNMRTITLSMEQLTATIKEIEGKADDTRKDMTNAVKQAEYASDKIDELSKTANEIGSVTEIITDISDQTNLLALNATIEAARAGESGKGFAVVAHEIKELANQTADATAKIKTQVEQIQASIGDRVKEISEVAGVIKGLNNNVSILASSVEEQSKTVGEISGNVEQMDMGISEISKNIAESTFLTSEITSDINSLNNIAEKITNRSSEVKTNSEGLFNMAKKMNGFVQTLLSEKQA